MIGAYLEKTTEKPIELNYLFNSLLYIKVRSMLEKPKFLDRDIGFIMCD